MKREQVKHFDREKSNPKSCWVSLSGHMRIGVLLGTLGVINGPGAFAVEQDPGPDGVLPVPGGTLDPTSIPKYVTPLVIPPVMDQTKPKKHTNRDDHDKWKNVEDADEDDKGYGSGDKYKIAVRQFKQQILPGGIWANTRFFPGCKNAVCDFPATTVWSYGPASDLRPNSKALGGEAGVAPAPNSQFNYPAYTIETTAYKPVDVRWINDLVNRDGEYLRHLIPVDQTLHWANPEMECAVGDPRTDCKGIDPKPYLGPVPIITHVHGAHVKPDSDGYPEAWFLPKASNIPAGYATSGSLFDDVTGKNSGNLGFADFSYQNDQPATTLWYHDHTLGMTRVNVYAGPAGFWLIRGGPYDLNRGLPGPAPVAGQGVLDLNLAGGDRDGIREIPIVIQDRSFNEDGSLFYPFDRAFFEGLSEGQRPPYQNKNVKIDFAPDSDVAPIWNPEAFFNVMVVNGVSWPSLEVADAIYRFRLLNGCNSRFLNLALFVVDSDGNLTDQEIPFYQIGAEQGFLPKVVKVQTGYTTVQGKDRTDAAAPAQALLMGLAERADVLVDFRGLPDGTRVRMINTAPDEPFGGFDEETVPADEETTGQVMEFVVNPELNGKSKTDPKGSHPATDPMLLDLPAEPSLGNSQNVRQVSLNEEISQVVCVPVNENGDYILVSGKLIQNPDLVPVAGQEVCVNPSSNDPTAPVDGFVPFGPTEALLGTVDANGGVPLKWTDNTGTSFPVKVRLNNKKGPVLINVTENPKLGDTEEWEIYNFTADAHPIHLHLVRFKVVKRIQLDRTDESVGGPAPNGVQPWETGFKDTVISYPGEITIVKAKFDLEGLYVWHCHIVEHEDNEMMRPYVVSADGHPHTHKHDDYKFRKEHKKMHKYLWGKKADKTYR